MEVKIDTKEKFHVLTLAQQHLSDNIAAQLNNVANECLNKEVRNVVLKLSSINSVDNSAAEHLARLQQKFYENNASFVICELSEEMEKKLDEMELLEVMNITPTESEAWDIVQMEEIERELLDNEDVEFNSHGEKD